MENVMGKENEKLVKLLENSITSVFSEVRKDFSKIYHYI